MHHEIVCFFPPLLRRHILQEKHNKKFKEKLLLSLQLLKGGIYDCDMTVGVYFDLNYANRVSYRTMTYFT